MAGLYGCSGRDSVDANNQSGSAIISHADRNVKLPQLANREPGWG